MPPSRKINKIYLYCANCAQFYSKFVLLFSHSLSLAQCFVRSFVRSFGVCTFVFIGLWFCLHKHRRHLKSLCAFPDFRYVYDCISVCVSVCVYVTVAVAVAVWSEMRPKNQTLNCFSVFANVFFSYKCIVYVLW